MPEGVLHAVTRCRRGEASRRRPVLLGRAGLAAAAAAIALSFGPRPLLDAAARGLAIGMRGAFDVAVTPAHGADEPSVEAVLEAHCRSREATRTLRARFVQTKVFTVLDEEDSSSGVLYYRKPDAVRWQYLEPDSSWTVLRDGKGWSVFPEIRQVQKFELRGSRVDALLSMVGFGACGSDLRESFVITLAPGADGTRVLELVPKTAEIGASFERVELTLDPKDHLPRRVVMHEVSGDTVRFEFLDLVRDVPIADEQFEYTTPKGYEVVE